MAWERHGRGMACVNQTRPHCLNQVEKTKSKPLAERPGRERHGVCEFAFSSGHYVLYSPVDRSVIGEHRSRYDVEGKTLL
jgi:hypothetical protein